MVVKLMIIRIIQPATRSEHTLIAALAGER